ncbi:hypothetical protein FF011L_03820 [Roseimaritima multifibrata]|uniref:Uncharacterized protein n=1 Tax=Roseimaritima multifibrata TaxID=1930274 RepID=A0A517M9Y2_9BACT|nr:hypothetical protein FF011L_03820 [Roseimaritima multifibrata]
MACFHQATARQRQIRGAAWRLGDTAKCWAVLTESRQDPWPGGLRRSAKNITLTGEYMLERKAGSGREAFADPLVHFAFGFHLAPAVSQTYCPIEYWLAGNAVWIDAEVSGSFELDSVTDFGVQQCGLDHCGRFLQ